MKVDLDNLLTEDHPSQLIEFSLVFRSSQQFDFAYNVPASVILQGEEAVEEYIVREALGDILYVEFTEEEKHHDP